MAPKTYTLQVTLRSPSGRSPIADIPTSPWKSIEQTFNGQADFGRRVTCTVSRNGDFAYRTYLQVTLPEVGQNDAKHARWLDFPGEQLISAG